MAAVAPVIDAKAEDVASAIAITAVLGREWCCCPVAHPGLRLHVHQYGVLAGRPSTLCRATCRHRSSQSVISSQIGTLVKLIVCWLLGPIIVVFSLTYRPVGARATSIRSDSSSFPGLLRDSLY